MEVWGITGVIGSGKTTAIQYLKEKGCPVIDADEVSRLVVDRHTPVGKEGFEKILRAFGPSVLDNLGNLDRKALRKKMMLTPRDRDTLESILHPLIVNYIRNIMREWKEKNVALGFVEGARLVESGFHNLLAGIVLVSASEPDRLKRIMKRDSMAKDEVMMMFGLQDESLMKSASRVQWLNSKTLKDFYKQIDAFCEPKLNKK